MSSQSVHIRQLSLINKSWSVSKALGQCANKKQKKNNNNFFSMFLSPPFKIWPYPIVGAITLGLLPLNTEVEISSYIMGSVVISLVLFMRLAKQISNIITKSRGALCLSIYSRVSMFAWVLGRARPVSCRRLTQAELETTYDGLQLKDHWSHWSIYHQPDSWINTKADGVRGRPNIT